MSEQTRPVSPTRDDPVVAALSQVVGGRFGAHAGPTHPVWRWQPSAVAVSVLIASATMLVALLARNHCRGTLWASPDQFTHLCYSDIPAVYSANGFTEGVLPYLQSRDGAYLSQPVGTGGLLWLLRVFTPGGDGELRWVFDAAALLLTVCLVVAVVAVGRLAGRREWDAALLAASPVLVSAALVSLDLVAVATGLVGWLLLSRGRLVSAGIALGVAVAIRPFEVILVLALLLVAHRRQTLGAAVPVAVSALITFVGLNAPVALAAPAGWAAYWTEIGRARLSYGSVWLVPQVLSMEIDGQQLPNPPIWLGLIGLLIVIGYGAFVALAPARLRSGLLPGSWVTTGLIGAALVVVPFMLVLVGARVLPQVGRPLPEITGQIVAGIGYPAVLVLTWWVVRRAPYPPRLPVVALLLGCGVLLVSPSIPVQASIWLLPLVALAVPSWRLMLTWAAVEFGYASLTWLYLYGLSIDNRGTPAWIYVLILFARVGLLIWLAWQAYTISMWPVDDVVRRDCGDDPAAGPVAAPQTDVVGPGPAAG